MSFPPTQSQQASPPPHFSQRRRSSAANTRPAGPPPNLPIPSLPGSHLNALSQTTITESSDVTIYSSGSDSISRGTRSSSFVRPSASPESVSSSRLFSVSPGFIVKSTECTFVPCIPPSMTFPTHPLNRTSLLPSLRLTMVKKTIYNLTEGFLAPPPEQPHRSENRPSSRRALTRALELAREGRSTGFNKR